VFSVVEGGKPVFQLSWIFIGDAVLRQRTCHRGRPRSSRPSTTRQHPHQLLRRSTHRLSEWRHWSVWLVSL